MPEQTPIPDWLRNSGVKMADIDTSAWTELARASMVSMADVTPEMVQGWMADTATVIMGERSDNA